MSDITIYHNPRCSKSRATLALIEAAGVTPEVVLYLESPPSADKLQALLTKLDMSGEQLVRKGEDVYKSLGLKTKTLSTTQWCEVMSENPKLIERPIVETQSAAVIGRPPENVQSLLS